MSQSSVIVVGETDPIPEQPVVPALVTGYEPDRFQKFAIHAIEQGHNVLVTAKTGSGKTFVGEYQIAKSLSRGGRVFYTTPVKSLSNQKFHDLKKLFPDATVGILTGDIKFQPDAQILVMTTEILRNLLFKRGSMTEKVGVTALLSLEGLDAVIFDEVHYINDPDRGHVWEECLMLLPATVKLILLSATLTQPYGFARWLSEGRAGRPVWLISTQWRAVPLEHCIFDAGAEKPLCVLDSREVFQAEVYRAWLAGGKAAELAEQKYRDKVRDARRAGFEGPVAGKTHRVSFEAQLNTCVNWLARTGNLPAIVFVFSRAGCEKLASKIQADLIDSSDSAAVRHIWDFHLSRYRENLETSPQAHTLRELACRGIAFHHSGLQPFLKEILEILFSKGYIKLLFATETFAVGINMPTKTVVFTAVEKFTDGQVRPLRSAEYIQMAGRAGRRGKDTRGLVLHLPQREPASLQEFQQVLTGQAGKFGSRMTFHYDFLLKVLNGEGVVGRAEDLIQKTYWYCLMREEVERTRRETQNLEAQVKAAESAHGALTAEQRQSFEERLSIEMRVATSQNAKKKQAQRELTRWMEDHPDSIWKPKFERFLATKKLYEDYQAQRNACALAEEELADANKMVPDLARRLQILREFGFVSEASGPSGHLTARGRLASEVNEGHPFLLPELFLDCSSRESVSEFDILTTLALFLGEAGDREDVEGNRKPSELEGVSDWTRETIRFLQDRAEVYDRAEQRLGLPDDRKFWILSTEWVEPIASWLSDPTLTVSALAAQYGLFEGNVLKGLMKMASLLEEWQSLATLAEQPRMLRLVEESRPQILRGIVLAESLYLRL